MSYSIIALLVVPLVLALINSAIDASIRHGRNQAPTKTNLFRVSTLVFLCCTVSIFLFAAVGLSALNDSRPQSAIVMIVGVSTVIALGSFLAIWWYACCTIRLTETELIIKTPLSQEHIRFENIKGVSVSDGLIIIDEGKVPRRVIPAIYKKTGLLLANIESRIREQMSS